MVHPVNRHGVLLGSSRPIRPRYSWDGAARPFSTSPANLFPNSAVAMPHIVRGNPPGTRSPRKAGALIDRAARDEFEVMTTTLITGANRGLGFETARQLLAARHTVYLGCRDAERGRSAAARLGKLDVTADASAAAAPRPAPRHTTIRDGLI
ncbi:hypothetical protein AB0H76_19635 [Nocardia sp. NPDC050712]|uniref:hypothetical protein n=1 Tax=Nocardia sp. NPDC050712 TaxID=3155518 RepID=UPI0033D591FC